MNQPPTMLVAYTLNLFAEDIAVVRTTLSSQDAIAGSKFVLLVTLSLLQNRSRFSSSVIRPAAKAVPSAAWHPYK